MDISANFQVTRDDLARVTRQTINLRFVAVASVLLLGAGAASFASHGFGSGIGLITAGAVLPFAIWWTSRQTVERNMHTIAEPWSVRFTDAGVELRTAVSNAEIAWSALKNVRSRKGFWLLRHHTQMVSFVPQAPFSAEEQATVEAFLAQRFPPDGRARKA